MRNHFITHDHRTGLLKSNSKSILKEVWENIPECEVVSFLLILLLKETEALSAVKFRLKLYTDILLFRTPKPTVIPSKDRYTIIGISGKLIVCPNHSALCLRRLFRFRNYILKFALYISSL